jgi:hypothetical protein
MLKITKASERRVVFKLSGRMDAENIGELEALLAQNPAIKRIVLDLKDLTLVDQGRCQFSQALRSGRHPAQELPPYIREWINGER